MFSAPWTSGLWISVVELQQGRHITFLTVWVLAYHKVHPGYRMASHASFFTFKCLYLFRWAIHGFGKPRQDFHKLLNQNADKTHNSLIYATWTQRKLCNGIKNGLQVAAQSRQSWDNVSFWDGATKYCCCIGVRITMPVVFITSGTLYGLIGVPCWWIWQDE